MNGRHVVACRSGVPGCGDPAAAVEELLSQQQPQDGDYGGNRRVSERGQVVCDQLPDAHARGERGPDARAYATGTGVCPLARRITSRPT